MPIAEPDELYAVLNELKPVLVSIDVRTVAVSQGLGEPWQNLVTSVCVSPKEKQKIESGLQTLPVYPRNNNFAIFTAVHPFDYTAFEQIINGEIKFLTEFGRATVKCRNFNPLNLKVNSSQERVGESLEFVWRAADSGNVETRKAFWTIVSNEKIPPIQLGFPNIIDLIKEFLKIPNFNVNTPTDFEFRLYNLARIEKSSFSDSSFKVNIKKVSGLKGLQLNLRRYEYAGSTLSGYHEEREIKQNEEQTDNNSCCITETFKVDRLLPLDTIKVKLIHKASALTLDEEYVTVPLKNPLEPFAKALNAFCTFEEFTKMLSEEVYKHPKPEVTFERAVAWLLSLGGFHTINLESKRIKSFDKVHVGAVEIGCADILAYKENNRLLLVDCTIRTPDAQKIQDLKDAKKHVSSILASYKGLRVVPLIFSPADCLHVQTDVEVRIIDKFQIKEILRKIARGEVEDIQHMF